MPENSEYDAAWDRRLAEDHAREIARRRVRAAARTSGGILVGLGACLAVVAQNGLAMVYACIADPICYPGLTGDPGQGFLGVEVAGVLLLLVGLWLLLSRGVPGRPTSAPR